MQTFAMSEPRYDRNWLGKYRTTPGVRDLAQKAGATWLVDRIAIISAHEPRVRQATHVVWTLKVHDDRIGMLTATDGDNAVLHVEPIGYTDFPHETATIWLMDGVMLLPSEY